MPESDLYHLCHLEENKALLSRQKTTDMPQKLHLRVDWSRMLRKEIQLRTFFSPQWMPSSFSVISFPLSLSSLSLPKALQIVDQQRKAYGLRNNDHARYRYASLRLSHVSSSSLCRKHCTNRTHRLRSTLKMTHGKAREFRKLPPITLEIVKEGQ